MQREAQEPVREPTASISQSLRRWTSRLSCLLVWCAALLTAAGGVGAYALDRQVPRARRGADSVRPWLPPGESVDVSIYLTASGDREALRDVEQPTLLLRNLTDDVSVTVPVPPATRLDGVPLWAHVCVRLPPIDAELEETEHCVGAAPAHPAAPMDREASKLVGRRRRASRDCAFLAVRAVPARPASSRRWRRRRSGRRGGS